MHAHDPRHTHQIASRRLTPRARACASAYQVSAERITVAVRTRPMNLDEEVHSLCGCIERACIEPSAVLVLSPPLLQPQFALCCCRVCVLRASAPLPYTPCVSSLNQVCIHGLALRSGAGAAFGRACAVPGGTSQHGVCVCVCVRARAHARSRPFGFRLSASGLRVPDRGVWP